MYCNCTDMSQLLVECDHSGTSKINDGVTPGGNMPDQTGRGDAINPSVDAKIGFAINVDGVQGNEDGGFLEEFARIKCDFLTVFELKLTVNTRNIRRSDRCTKNVLAILWIGNPANPC